MFVDQSYAKIGKTREVAFEVSEDCEDRKQMKYEEAQSIEEAVLKAYKMLKDEKFWII